MLIKEYRIPLPMSVEEYRIAQLYMIQKKSRLESVGEGSGVEIIENRPYSNGPGGSGQYTKKIYHIGSHLPGWLKAILPKAALRVQEEAWNAYPYTRMRTTCPFVEKFYVDVETYYYPDGGQQENVFKLSSSEIQNREVDLIDPIKDSVSTSDYREEEDPLLYKSGKTGRGPMKENWLTEYQCDTPPSAVMCAYKLIKVEFRYWGMQSKIEHFIHGGLRRPMLLGHRQAWVWQDEWYGLTIEDIRNLELETQQLLAQKMGHLRDGPAPMDRDSDQEEGFACEGTGRGSVVSATAEVPGSRMDLLLKESIDEPDSTDLDKDEALELNAREDQRFGKPSEPKECPVLPRISLQRDSMSSFESCGGTFHVNAKRISGSDVLREWHMTSIQTPGSDSDEEFFDAQEELDESFEEERTNLLRVRSEGLGSSLKGLEIDTDSPHGSEDSLDSLDLPLSGRQRKSPSRRVTKQPLCKKVSDSSTCSVASCQITNLVLLIHGGNQLDTSRDSVSKKMDSQLLLESFNAVINAHYRGALGRIVVRLVECPSICSKALSLLSQLCPHSESDSDCGSVSSGFTPVSCSFPVGAIPLIVTSSPAYQEQVGAMIASANSVYQDFLHSEQGLGFRGEVALVGDCMGALLAFDALCSLGAPRSRAQSVSSEYSTSSMAVPQMAPYSPGPTINTDKPNRRTSSHVAPVASNLEASKSLRLSVSSGHIAEHVSLQTGEGPRAAVDHDNSRTFPTSPASQTARRQNFSFDTSSMSVDSLDYVCFEFEVTKFFAFGSPIGLVIAYRRFLDGDEKANLPPCRPLCSQVYNLFHPFDPAASRLEPLIIPQFSQIQAVNVPRYHRFPLGDGQSHLLHNTLGAYPELFLPQVSPRRAVGGDTRLRLAAQRDGKASPVSSNGSESPVPSELDSAVNSWWGSKRLDFALYCPEGLQQFPTAVLSPLFHVSYWESSDVAAFVVREILHGEWDLASLSSPSKKGMTFSPAQPLEKWSKRRTFIKIKNLNANHRANDSVAMESAPQVITARFMYGPLDMVSLSGEKVDVYVMTQPPSGEYQFFDSVTTVSGGRLTYQIPEEKRLAAGIYPVKMVVRGDHTCVDSNLAILPPKTEAVVFSIDGSFTAGVSLRGKDPKVRAGAVDVVRHWQQLGFLIVYVTSRLDFQKHKVMSWLAEHNFPFGLVAFGDGISKELQKHKTEFLRSLKNDCQVVIQAAYGSTKDISVYASIGLQPNQIYIVGKNPTKKYEKQAQLLKEGYAAHLTTLSSHPISRLPVGNSRIILRRGCFGLPSRASKSKGKVKRSQSDKPISDQEKEMMISGSFNYSSFRNTKGRSSTAKLQPDFYSV